MELNERLDALGKLKDGYKARNLYKLLKDDPLWYMAYQNIYSNHGAFTKGVNSDTLDGFDKIRLKEIKDSLFNYSYKPTPVRRVNIPKPNGKTRPLGIPTGTDKLVQEACRIILEAIYEPKFSNLSHGFRPNRSCHTALKEVSGWTGTKWFIEVDIKGYFDNINHNILMDILSKRIEDVEFLNLIRKFLNAGYIENWKYNKTYSGTPQGGIISPILANIYLDKFDKWIEPKCNNINATENNRKDNPEYKKIASRKSERLIRRNKINLEQIENDKYLELNRSIISHSEEIRSTLFNITEGWYLNQRNQAYNRIKRFEDTLDKLCRKHKLDYYDTLNVTKYKVNEELLNILTNDINRLDSGIRKLDCQKYNDGLNRLKYVRYADDFILGYIGTKKEAENILKEIRSQLSNNLKLEVSEDKTKVVHRTKGIKFLGYNIIFKEKDNEKLSTNSIGIKKRRNQTKPRFKVPTENAIKFVKDNGYGSYVENESTHRSYLINYDIYEIITQYNAELRGIIQYYKYACNVKDIIGRVQWLAHYSLLKTIASKHKCSVAQVFKRNIIKTKRHPRIGKTWYYKIPNTDKTIEIFNIKDIEYVNLNNAYELQSCNDKLSTIQINIRNSAVKKLIANTCELCGKTKEDGIAIHLHHKNPCKNIPKTDPLWKQVQKMRQRKTVALCEDCHKKVHRG
jgi:retron-type reverse transcriptase